jgi:hypothetical protein
MSILNSSSSSNCSGSNKTYNDYEYSIIVDIYNKNKSQYVEHNIQYTHLKTHLNTLINISKTHKPNHSHHRFDKINQPKYLQKTHDNIQKHKKYERHSSFSKHNHVHRMNRNNNLNQSQSSSVQQSLYHSRNKYSTLRTNNQNSKSLTSIEVYKKSLRSHLNKYTSMNKGKISEKIKCDIEDVLSKEKQDVVVTIFLDTFFEMVANGKVYLQLYIELFNYVFIENNTHSHEYKEIFLKYIETKNIEYISLIEIVQSVNTSDYDAFCLYNKESDKRVQYFTLSILIYSMYVWTPDIVFTNPHAFDRLYGLWKQNVMYEKHTTCCTEIIKIIVNIVKNKSIFNEEFFKSLHFCVIDIYRTVQRKELCHGLSNKSYFEILNLDIEEG